MTIVCVIFRLLYNTFRNAVVARLCLLVVEGAGSSPYLLHDVFVLSVFVVFLGSQGSW